MSAGMVCGFSQANSSKESLFNATRKEMGFLLRESGRRSLTSPAAFWSGRSPCRSPLLLASPTFSSSPLTRATICPFELSGGPTRLREDEQRHRVCRKKQSQAFSVQLIVEQV